MRWRSSRVTPSSKLKGFAGTQNLTFGAPGRGALKLSFRRSTLHHLHALPPWPALLLRSGRRTPTTAPGGLRVFAPALRQVQWLPKFKPKMPPHYDGMADPSDFLLAYEEAVLEAGGNDSVMANWLPMALAGALRA